MLLWSSFASRKRGLVPPLPFLLPALDDLPLLVFPVLKLEKSRPTSRAIFSAFEKGLLALALARRGLWLRKAAAEPRPLLLLRLRECSARPLSIISLKSRAWPVVPSPSSGRSRTVLALSVPSHGRRVRGVVLRPSLLLCVGDVVVTGRPWLRLSSLSNARQGVVLALNPPALPPLRGLAACGQDRRWRLGDVDRGGTHERNRERRQDAE